MFLLYQLVTHKTGISILVEREEFGKQQKPKSSAGLVPSGGSEERKNPFPCLFQQPAEATLQLAALPRFRSPSLRPLLPGPISLLFWRPSSLLPPQKALMIAFRAHLEDAGQSPHFNIL